MREEIGSYDAKTKLPEILRRVEAGEAFTITNRGKPIADLIPSHSAKGKKVKEAVSNLLKMKKHDLSEKDLNQFKAAGRK